MAYLVISSEKETRVIHVERGWASFQTPYFEGYAVDDLKATVPTRARRWDDDTKTWSVKVEYLHAIEELADAFGPFVVEGA